MNMFPSAIVSAAREWSRIHVRCAPFASINCAQWALESAYGRMDPSGSDNPFGIKAVGSQPYVISWTHETLHGVYKPIPQHFARYNSEDDAFQAHMAVLLKPIYHAAQAATNPKDYANALTGIYATGIPGHPYGEALIKIMDAANLYQLDTVTT